MKWFHWNVVVATILAGALMADQATPVFAASGQQQQEEDADEQKPDDLNISIHVVGLIDDEPIPRFRVLAGVPTQAGIPEAFKERTDAVPVSWQPHTLRVGRDGIFHWPLARTYEKMCLRVEAEGYKPQKTDWVVKGDGPQKIVVQLRRDPQVRGTVTQPDGRPAPGATIAIALPAKDARIAHGQIRGANDPLPTDEADRWRLPTFARTDAEGRFRIYTETDEAAAVLIVHDSGVREMSIDEFKREPDVRLHGWGRIEGRVLWHDKPGAEEKIDLSAFRMEYGYPGMISWYEVVTTDKEGRFAVDKVLPGPVGASSLVRLPNENNRGITTISFPGRSTHATVLSGEPTPMLIGGRGRTVTGRFIGRDSWDAVSFLFHPDAPHFGFPGDDEAWQGFGIFRQSDIGPLFFRGKLKPKADGTFEIPHMLPGRYQLFVSAPGVKNWAGGRTIVIEPEVPGEEPAPLDIGTIAVSTPDAARPAE